VVVVVVEGHVVFKKNFTSLHFLLSFSPSLLLLLLLLLSSFSTGDTMATSESTGITLKKRFPFALSLSCGGSLFASIFFFFFSFLASR